MSKTRSAALRMGLVGAEVEFRPERVSTSSAEVRRRRGRSSRRIARGKTAPTMGDEGSTAGKLRAPKQRVDTSVADAEDEAIGVVIVTLALPYLARQLSSSTITTLVILG